MARVVIENSILDSPFGEPTRRFRFVDERIANEVADGRRESSWFIPISEPRTKGRKLLLDTPMCFLSVLL
jgi:type III restriction enzyme